MLQTMREEIQQMELEKIRLEAKAKGVGASLMMANSSAQGCIPTLSGISDTISQLSSADYGFNK